MPDNYSEDSRYLYLHTPLGPSKLILLKFNGYEAMSELFRFQLEVAAMKDEEVAFDQLIGKAISFGVLATDDKDPRHFDGICIEFSEGVRDSEFKYYTIVVVPKLWMTTQKRTCKIFQQKSVHDILTTVLAGIDTDFKLQGTYEPREFCVQYNETDFDFASRLMEEEGIGYYFKFEEGSHKMVLMDSPQGHVDVPGGTKYNFDQMGGGNRFEDEERVNSWRRIQSWGSAKYTLWDHNFQLTDKHLDSDKTINPETVAAGDKTHKLKLNGNDAFEIFEYPGNYAKRFDGIASSGGEQASELNKMFTDNGRTVGIRMKQVATPSLLFSGGGNGRRFTAGHKFTLAEHYDANGTYVLTSVTHSGVEGDFRAGADVNVEHYENSFTAIPVSLPFAPARRTARPRVFGCQTAKVVGPPGEEIFTDKYGRVKVQFRWDREGQENASSSCWLRVGTPWAGKNWGMIHIPRIGQEVIVDFMEGDPDRPIIVGSVYNPDQMPPYILPDNKTQSGLQTRSSKGGGPANCNEIKFEDKKGDEMVWIHAEKDHTGEVEHDEKHWVGNDQTITVDNNRTETVKAVEKVNVKGDRHNKIEGNHLEDYGQEHSLKIGQNHNMKVGMNHGVDAGMCISMKAGVNIVLEASVGITLKAGASSITISPAGIMISGTPMCLINTAAVALPGVPVVCIPPMILPPVPKIPPIPGMPNLALPALPSLPPLPPLPNIAALAGQVTSVLNSAVSSAAQLVNGISSQLLNQVNSITDQVLGPIKALEAEVKGVVDEARGLVDKVEGSIDDVKKSVEDAVEEVKGKIDDAVDEAKGEVEDAVNEVKQEAQEALKEAAGEVADLTNEAKQTLQGVQQQVQQVANQAEQIANEAMQQGKAALAEASQQAQNAAQQAQELAHQAEQQLQQVADQAEQTAKDAMNQGQQELNAASQQLNAMAQQAKDGVQQVQQQVQNTVQQTEQMAQQAAQEGEQAVAQAAQQARQAAQQAAQQAQQAASQAEQAAQAAAQQAEQQSQAAVKSVEDAAQKAGQQVQDAATDGQKQIASAANDAAQRAQDAGNMTKQQADNLSNSVSNTASNAANQVGQAASQAFGQVGTAAGQAVKGVENALGGLGR